MTAPTEPTDSDLEQALERARTAKPAGPGINKGTLALASVVLAGGGFLGGYLAGGQGAGGPEGPGGMVMRGEGPGGGPGIMPANLTMGTIQSISGNTITIKTESGDTVKAKISDGTIVEVTKDGSIKDLTKGDNVVVNGQRDGDTIDAEDVHSGMLLRKDKGDGAGG